MFDGKLSQSFYYTLNQLPFLSLNLVLLKPFRVNLVKRFHSTDITSQVVKGSLQRFEKYKR